jgi:ABC-type sugar transport system ATPase subunit
LPVELSARRHAFSCYVSTDGYEGRQGRSDAAMSVTPIEARALAQSFGFTPVLRAINLQVEPGTGVLICGRNGAGKSTLLSLLAGLGTRLQSSSNSSTFDSALTPTRPDRAAGRRLFA